MWPARRLTALLSLKAFVGPFRASEAQLPACNSAAAALNHGSQSQWQQTRGMAVPKRKTSPSRRGHRNAMKFHKFVTSIAKCSLCSMLMHPHQIPHYFCERDDCPSKITGSRIITAEPSSS